MDPREMTTDERLRAAARIILDGIDERMVQEAAESIPGEREAA